MEKESNEEYIKRFIKENPDLNYDVYSSDGKGNFTLIDENKNMNFVVNAEKPTEEKEGFKCVVHPLYDDYGNRIENNIIEADPKELPKNLKIMKTKLFNLSLVLFTIEYLILLWCMVINVITGKPILETAIITHNVMGIFIVWLLGGALIAYVVSKIKG